MNGRKTIPINDWEMEQKDLTAKMFTLTFNLYYRLRDEMRNGENICIGAEQIME